MGAGCVAFLNAELIKGTDLVFDYSKAEEHIQQSDIVITGEGKIDEQTFNGKLVDAVAQLCIKNKKQVIALCGTLDISQESVKANGLTAAFSIINKPMNIDEAFKNAFLLLNEGAYAIANLL